MNDERQNTLRSLPGVGDVLHHPLLADERETAPRSLLVEAIRAEVEAWRDRLLADPETAYSEPHFLAGVKRRVRETGRPRLRRVINATGVVVHTNLGRSPLSREALAAIAETAGGYSNLEYDLAAGKRGSRFSLVEGLLCELTGAEAALVVNNNAAAVLLALATLAQGREAIVSRGELVEIGGSFRLPDVLSLGGVRLVEVGTTNRTHPRDYERAITDQTAILMKVHASNYQIVGFTSEVPGAELTEMAHRHHLLAVEDLGSGSLLTTADLGLPPEPTAPEAVKSGMDLVTFSGDKLLGGPQAGILLGRRELIAACAKNPLHRALRIDKLTLAALEATLRLYREPQKALESIPTLRLLAADPKRLERRARRLAARLKKTAGEATDFTVEPASGRVGGGALPFAELPGPVLVIRPRHLSLDELTRALRSLETPIILRLDQGRAIADPRTILEADEPAFLAGLAGALQNSRVAP
ncbi:MAG: L-seryl-tRNA(Sec) selenium transferase [Myxococcales bacterium]|nr:L-seryl-tRNA(Sec) selenium transferase [Myxococcales bacterium]